MDLRYFFIIALTFVPVLFLTYRIKKKWLLWPLIVIPPLLLAPLALFPYSSPLAGIVWLPVLPFFLGSIIILIIRAIIILGTKTTINKITLIRPTITVLMFLSIFAYHRVSRNMADQYAITFAKSIQAICDSNSLCPISIPDWAKETGGFGDHEYSRTIHKLQIPYFIKYRPSPDRGSFSVRVIHGFNMSTCVSGGTNQKLRASYSDEEDEYDIPIK
jgi:hypothetical protein